MTATRRLAAILAADVAGYSRLIGADEGGTLEAFKTIRTELFEPTITAHNGRLVKTTGDGLLVEFSSVVDALRCATVVQASMAGRNATVPRLLIAYGDCFRSFWMPARPLRQCEQSHEDECRDHDGSERAAERKTPLQLILIRAPEGGQPFLTQFPLALTPNTLAIATRASAPCRTSALDQLVWPGGR